MDKTLSIDILMIVGLAGGVENVVNAVAPALKARGHRVRVVQIVSRNVRWVVEDIPFYTLLERKKEQNLGDFADAYRSFLESGEGRESLPDLVLGCGWPYTVYIAKKSAMDLGLSCKVVSWLHSPVKEYIEAGFGTWESLRLADAHLAISREIEEELRRNIPDRPVLRVHNPVMFPAHTETNAETSAAKRELYFIGRLTREKCPELAMEALAASHTSYHLTLIGDGGGEAGRRQELKKLAKRLGVADRVFFPGWKEDPWAETKDAEAVLITSRAEGFSLVAIEALARGIPVISTPVGVIPEILQPGVNGYVFPQGDASSLAKILDAMEGGLLPRISAEACVRSVQAFESGTALQGFCEALHGVLQP
ncbi:MAG: glycosyltransferase [Lachnospiraceae bacterium]|nr:glycosyltransferase [Lachnospiraceae bacterium]